MSKLRSLNFNGRESYEVSAKVVFDGVEIEGVPCEVIKPEKFGEKPHLVFRPAPEVSKLFERFWQLSFSAELLDKRGNKTFSFHSSRAYVDDFSANHSLWRHDCTVVCEPQDLHISRFLGERDRNEKSSVSFFISENSFLIPRARGYFSDKGVINYTPDEDLEFYLASNHKLKFERRFSFKEVDGGDLMWPYLVAFTEIDCSADDVVTINNVMKELNDFLLVSSLAKGTRTVCLGWKSIDGCMSSEFYCGDFSKLNEGVDPFFVVSESEREEFIKTCYKEFSDYENKSILRSALYSVTPHMPVFVETSFLHLFAGLESLVLDYRRYADLEFVLRENDFKKFKKYLEECIKKYEAPKLSADQRCFMYKKLSELNRVPLRDVFDRFCGFYCLDLSDLWPVFGCRENVGLSDIRNKLIHGDPLSSSLIHELCVAENHLKHTLIRALLGVLKWDVSQTRVSREALARDASMELELVKARQNISKFVYQQYDN